MKRLLIAIISILSSTQAIAELSITEPFQACNLMSEIGLKTGGWKNHYEQEYGCSSPYKDIGEAFPLPNNIAFYAEGDRDSVKLVKLVLNINDPSSETIANEVLQYTASILIPKISGEMLSTSIQSAISHGNNFSEKIGTSMVNVVRENWPTGKGYEIKVIIN